MWYGAAQRGHCGDVTAGFGDQGGTYNVEGVTLPLYPLALVVRAELSIRIRCHFSVLCTHGGLTLWRVSCPNRTCFTSNCLITNAHLLYSFLFQPTAVKWAFVSVSAPTFVWDRGYSLSFQFPKNLEFYKLTTENKTSQ